MKLVIAMLIGLSSLHASAFSWKDLLPIIVGGQRPAPYPGQPYPGQPYPGSGPIVCESDDRGWEEHARGHYSCGECLQYHGECVETCSSVYFEARAEGTDNTGRTVTIIGRGPDQWRAQDDANWNCQRSYLQYCHVIGVDQRQNVVSRRMCPKF